MSWEQYFEKNSGRPVRHLYAKAIEFLTVDEVGRSTAVDLGCGAGIETADLLHRGWDVTAIDREPASISAVLKLVDVQSNRRLRTICSRFEDLDNIPEADFIYAYHSLPFCDADHFERLLGAVSEAIKPKGVFAGSFFGLNDDWVKAGRNTGVSAEQLMNFFSTFDIISYEETDKMGNTALQGPKHWHTVDVIGRKKT